MYDPQLVLAAIDRNAIQILALCSFAMACNYYFFFMAAWRGFKDQAYPLPVFSVLFWLAGDGTFALDYNLAFNVINHWYVKLFWVALLFTVAFELLYLYMILRFGRKEIAPEMSQPQFVAVVLGGVVAVLIAWNFIKGLINDPLAINYFHLANLAGPAFVLALYTRRKSQAGTAPSVWIAYTLMSTSWSLAVMMFYGPPFASPPFLAVYAATFITSIVTTWTVMRLPRAPSAAHGAAAAGRASSGQWAESAI